MKKKFYGTALLILLLFIGGITLWRHSHQSYQADYEAETEFIDGSDMNFPKTVKAEISDFFSYDADIIVGEEFKTDQCYIGTGRIVPMSLEKWKNFFCSSDQIVEQREDQFFTREGEQCKGNFFALDNGAQFYVSEQDAYFDTDQMQYIIRVLDISPTSETYNMNQYGTDNQLDFATRDENWDYVTKCLTELGIPIKDVEIISCYGMEVSVMEAQEEYIYSTGAMEESERKDHWSKEDEGYFYFIRQKWQGLPLYRDKYVNDYKESDISPSLQLFVSDKGIQFIRAYYLFEVEEDKPCTLCSFEKVKETLDEKYGNIEWDNRYVVRKCELVEYPLWTEDSYTVIPVWICTVAMQCQDEFGNEWEQNTYIPVNAVTGLEMFELEG